MQAIQKYHKVASHEAHKGEFKKCLLLYSGGLDTSVMLKWIQEQYDCDVITLTLDIGQEADDLQAIEEKAKKLGAVKTIVIDAKKQFAETILAKAIQANADYQDGYDLSTVLGRVIICELAVATAKAEGCQVIAHGSTGKGNDQVRFDSYVTTLAPELKIIAPVREWGMGRQEEIAYAKEHNIPVKQTSESPYSYDENMWGSSAEGGEIEHPHKVPNLAKILLWCSTPQAAPDTPELLKLTFTAGIPTKVDGLEMSLDKLIGYCNALGGKHGVGVHYQIEDRLIGLKIRDIYESPGANIILTAHKRLEQMVSTQVENELKSYMDSKWAHLAYNSLWFEPTMRHIHAYMADQNQKVSGEVTIELYKGSITVVALDSPYSLFDHALMTSDIAEATFNQNASPGFIEIHNLAQKTAHKIHTQMVADATLDENTPTKKKESVYETV
ncbi:MAG TPA: argininosuccinate synthase [Patescibacteria group bacterium]|nr:argininosuccinate synthase [Patescibacteria group bacterium]